MIKIITSTVYHITIGQKRRIFGVGDGLKMVEHGVWARIVAHKSVGSMTTNRQMKPTLRVSFKAPQAGGSSRSNAPNMRSYPRL